MNDTNNISNNNSTNKTRKPIGASTKQLMMDDFKV